MLARIWRTKLDISRIADYEHFAIQRSFPMFKDQPGFLGVLFARQEADCAVITFWDQPAAIEALESSPVYLTTVAEINQTGFLVGDASVDILDIHAGEISLVACALARPPAPLATPPSRGSARAEPPAG
jgi:heme-degrading monooxygenase HmoA